MTDPYTAAWLAEMWPVCHEFTAPPREPDLHRRNCPRCGKEMAAKSVARHLRERHPRPVDKAGEKRREVAS